MGGESLPADIAMHMVFSQQGKFVISVPVYLSKLKGSSIDLGYWLDSGLHGTEEIEELPYVH
jgi:hypothetical protein